MWPMMIGLALPVAVALASRLAGLDRDRALYPVILIVIASYEPLFAVMASAWAALGRELLIFAVFTAIAVTGFRRSLKFVAFGLVLHGVFDLVHDEIVINPGVPGWWPAFCASYDVVAMLGLAAPRLKPARDAG